MLPELKPQDFELTLEQRFLISRYTEEIKEIPLEMLQASFLEVACILMIKDNLIRALMRKAG
ncbi:NblA/ycf18 family protein [Plectonema radiosum NIES-515]|uniref:NblA/ycf18 family protein n=1 Tax=Plectonema radiosum NIES-515 TaxID=2986073 RepID=A0ABT3B002_9CYAN|nr:NblA/ycf18 family protein [Plectonema radiosum]MCV3214707.1 NblA/ycf18 family protein [Plectonema radiosum NIES-515]